MDVISERRHVVELQPWFGDHEQQRLRPTGVYLKTNRIFVQPAFIDFFVQIPNWVGI